MPKIGEMSRANASGRLQVNQAVDTFITFSVRFANSYLGGEMWIAWARLVGLQGDKPDDKKVCASMD